MNNVNNVLNLGTSPVRKFINEFHEQQKQKARENGRADGVKGIIKSTDTSIGFYIEFLTTAYISLHAQCMEILNPKLQTQLGKEENIVAQKETLEKAIKMNALRNQNENDQKSIEDVPVLSVFVALSIATIGSFLLFLTELYFFGLALQSLGKTQMISWWVGAAISFGLMAIATFAPIEIEKCKSSVIRYLAYIILFALIIGSMYVFGVMRSDYISLMGGHQISPLFFTLLNFISFIGQILLGKYLINPILAEIRPAIKACWKRFRIIRRRWIIHRLEAEDKQSGAELQNGLTERFTTISEAENLPSLLNNLFKENVSVYKSSYAETCKDPAGIPACFHQPIPDLDFTGNSSSNNSFSAAIIILCMALFSFGCIEVKEPITETNICLIDRTDSLTISPQQIYQRLNQKLTVLYDQYAGAEVIVQPITQYRNTPKFRIAISSEDMLSINEIERKHKIHIFKEALHFVIDTVTSRIIPQPESEVLYPIMNALITLASSTSQKRSMDIFSDLRENTELISLYDPVIIQRLTEHPEWLRSKLDSVYHLPSLKGITVTFFYTPTTKSNDKLFSLMAESVLKPFLEQHTATVYIASLPGTQ